MRLVLTGVITAATMSAHATADLVFYHDADTFEAAMVDAGATDAFVETFEENSYPDESFTNISPPLASGIANPPFERGLAAPGLVMTIDGSDEPWLLFLLTAGGEVPSDVVGPSFFEDDTVLTFTSGDTMGAGVHFYLFYFVPEQMQFDVLDTRGARMGSIEIPVIEGLNYIAARSTDEPIGAIVSRDPLVVAGEMFDRIAMYETPDGVPGDLDDDGAVDFTDLLGMLAAWGHCANPPADCSADIDGDGTVGFADLLTLLASWTQ